MSYIAYQQDILNAINQVLSDLQPQELQKSCPTGTFNNIDIKCANIKTNITDGNTKKTGEYTTIDIDLNTIKNLINFQFLIENNNGTDVNDTELTISTNLKANMSNSTNFEIDMKGDYKYYEYIPGFDVSGCYIWEPSWTKKCWKSPFGKKYCIKTLGGGWKCAGKADWWVPSTYSPNLPLDEKSLSIKLKIYGVSISSNLTYILSLKNPNISNTIIKNITNTSVTTTYTFYVYNFNMSIYDITWNSYSLTEGSMSSSDVSSILNDVYSNFGIFEAIPCIQINISP